MFAPPKREEEMKKRGRKNRGLYLRGRTWWMTYIGPDGKQHWESCHTKSKTESQALLEKRKVCVREDNLPEVKRVKPALFSELARDYEAWAKKQKGFLSKRIFMRKLVEAFGCLRVNRLTTKAVEQHQTRLLEQGLKPATVNRVLATLKHMVTKAVQWEMASEEVLKRVRCVKQLPEHNRRLRYLSKEEMARLIEKCEPHLRPIVITALNTGMRKGEILGLKWDQVDLKNGFILLDRTKSGERREIPINQTLRDTLEALPRHITGPYVFWQGKDGRRYGDVKKSFRSALKRANIRDFHFHDTRHCFA
jgi:integrase